MYLIYSMKKGLNAVMIIPIILLLVLFLFLAIIVNETWITETQKNWMTLLMVIYGLGGVGFLVTGL